MLGFIILDITSNRQFLYLRDFLIGPVFFGIIILLAQIYAKKQTDDIYRKYFVKGITIRLLCAVLLALIYQYYYSGGDTCTYYEYETRLRSIMFENPSAFLNLAFSPNYSAFYADQYFGTGAAFYSSDSARLIIRIALIVGYFVFNSYMLISFVFTLFCFYGCWKLFKVFRELYPHLEKEIAIACLFLPSVCFWGSGVLKDPVCMGAIGLLTYHIYKLFFSKQKKPYIRMFVIIICIYIIKSIKMYIVLSFVPSLALWVIYRTRANISSGFIRSILGPVFYTVGIFIAVFVLIRFSRDAERYAVEALVRTAKDTQNWLLYSSQIQGGSGYSLGNLEYTPLGLLKAAPKAINVTLFRPYLWEARKPILIPAAIEGFISLFLTLMLLYKTGFVRFIKMVLANPEVQFFMVFSLVFAFSVGFTSFNFGSLVRYKIPMMPFYFMALFILADTEKKESKVVQPLKSKMKKNKNTMQLSPT